MVVPKSCDAFAYFRAEDKAGTSRCTSHIKPGRASLTVGALVVHCIPSPLGRSSDQEREAKNEAPNLVLLHGIFSSDAERLTLEKQCCCELLGKVRYCVYREFGYFLGIEFEPGSKWSAHHFRPQHMLDPRRLVIRSVNRASKLANTLTSQ
jgi:hypothetical protein